MQCAIIGRPRSETINDNNEHGRKEMPFTILFLPCTSNLCLSNPLAQKEQVNVVEGASPVLGERCSSWERKSRTRVPGRLVGWPSGEALEYKARRPNCPSSSQLVPRHTGGAAHSQPVLPMCYGEKHSLLPG